jgi:16S rRNA processing protein RimM
VSGDAGAAPQHLVVGHISKPHGTKGEVFVWPLTDSPAELFIGGASLLLSDATGELAGDGASLAIERARPFKRGVLVKFEGLEDRNAVEPLHGRYLFLPLDALPPLADDELFYHQLIGAQVETVEGGAVGTVREVYEIEPAHMLEVVGPDGRLHLVPFTAAIVKQVDREARRLVIDPPAGLLEL